MEKPNIFYDTSHLNLKEKKKLLRLARSLSTTTYKLDKLDCSKSWRREIVDDINFDQAVEMLRDDSFFTVIYRKYQADNTEILEIGYRQEQDDGDYFLWLYVEPTYSNSIFNKFNLEPQNT